MRDEPIAVAGMACRYPDADGPDRLWELVLTRRRAFRRIPEERLSLADYFDPDPHAPDKTYSTRAALLEGWTFDRDAFRIPGPIFRATDPAHWLALETADRALADAGFPEGHGLDRDRVAVIMGNTLTGEMTRASTMRLRWPYVRRVLEAALAGEGLPRERRDAVLDRVAAGYLAPFEPVGDETLAGGLSNTIAGRVCNHFDLHGGCYTVDGACASSLLAVVNACHLLRTGEADLVLAGGVDLSLDPFELIGFAKAGALARDRMRVYDERSAGFWPGEGCGVVALMRAADAPASYAEIVGTGLSSDGRGGITRPERAGQLLALRRAYAGLDPREVGLIEGHGTGTAVGDATEIAALTELRPGATPAALGSIKANIGHTKAAAGLAGLIKAALGVASGTLPPTTGCERPHPLLRDASLRVLDRPEPWSGTRVAGVSAMGFGGVNTHVVLREPAARRAVTVGVIAAEDPERAAGDPERAAGDPPPGEDDVFVLSGDVRPTLERLAAEGARLSISELHDLACHLAARPVRDGVRVALVAGTPERLAERAGTALRLLTALPRGRLAAENDVYAGDGVAGRVTLLFPGQGARVPDSGTVGLVPDSGTVGLVAGGGDTAAAQPAIFRASMEALRELDRLGVRAIAGIGHSLGEISGLVWAGCLDEREAEHLTIQRGLLMSRLGRAGTGMISIAADGETARRIGAETGLTIAAYNGPGSHVLAGPDDGVRAAAELAAEAGIAASVLPVRRAFHSAAVADCAAPFKEVLDAIAFRPPRGRLISTVTGRELTGCDAPAEVLCAQITAPVLFWEALTAAIGETDLFCEAGPGRTMGALVGARCDVPVAETRAAPAALFAASAVDDLRPLFAGRAARPIDIWRDRVFLVNPCSSAAAPRAPEDGRAPAMATGGDDVAALVVDLVARTTELDPSAISRDQRLLADLNLTSLSVGQLVAGAARAAGRTPPLTPLALADATVGEMIDEIETLPAADEEQPDLVPGVAQWIRCFTESPGPAAPPSGDPGEDGVTVRVPDVTEDGAAGELLAAARDGVEAGRLTVVTCSPGLSGFLRSLCQEYPRLAATLVRTPAGAGVLASPWLAAAAPGEFREIHLDADGRATSPRPRPVPVEPAGPAGPPVDRSDVVLVSGGGKGIGYECAAALARATGASLALLGRSDSPAVSEALERLAAEGVAAAYEPADVTDAGAVAHAVRRLGERLGRITAVVHAAGVNRPRRFAELTEADLAEHLAPKVAGLRNLLAAVPGPGLVVTFGSVIGRYGLAGESHYALANGALRAEAERRSGRVFHVDWSVWTGTGMGERLGVLDSLLRRDVAPISVAEGSELFVRLLGRPGAAVAVHGRVGLSPEEAPARDGGPHGRFLERIRVHYPEVELVAEADLGLRRNPDLNDHRIDGHAVLPGVIMLEAMAEAASWLLGGPVRSAAGVALERPVVVPDEGSARVRICALRRDDGAVEAVLRSAATGMRTDHARAVFTREPDGEPPVVSAPGGARLSADELYGELCFHTGRFRRVRELRATARSVHAELDPAGGDAGLLGDPLTNDATIHALQACVPHRRLLPVGCDRLTLGGTEPVRLAAAERAASGGDYTWDVVAEDASGRPAVVWEGLRLRDAGPLRGTAPWPASLLGIYLERMATALGLAPGLRIAITSGTRSSYAPPRTYGTSRSHQGGRILTVHTDGTVPRKSVRVACDWEAVGPRSGEALGPDAAALVDQLRERCGEPREAAETRLWTVIECLSKLGRAPTAPLVLAGVYEDGWALLRSGGGRIASAVLDVAGEDGPVAIAIMTDG